MTLSNLLIQLRADFPAVTFISGKTSSWSPYHQTVTYQSPPLGKVSPASDIWALLHEVGHAQLGHRQYHSDVELLRLEAAAWQQAVIIGRQYGITINEDHLQDCLDTYRDWLHGRSKCPTCGAHSVQSNATTYVCHNCRTTWQVSASRFCRPHRRVVKKVAV